MARINLGGKSVYDVESGKTVTISASLSGRTKSDPKEKKPNIFFSVYEGEGEVDKNGVFHAPLTLVDKTAKVLIKTSDHTIAHERAEIRITKGFPFKPRRATLLSGGEVHFKLDPAYGINPRWEIADFSRGKGNIDPNSGIYKSPEIVSKAAVISVRLKDLDSTFEETAEVTLLPIELKDKGDIDIRAGEKKVLLNVESHNDSQGLDNFFGRIVSRPKIGEIVDDIYYLPPLRIDKPGVVEIEASSKTDPSIKERMKINLGFPKCKKTGCPGEIRAKGKCDICKSSLVCI